MAGEQFTKEQRLRNREEFLACYRQGKRVPHPYFTLYILKRKAGKTRLGVTVSRKLGGAVLRNRIKRRIRTIFRRSDAFPKAGYDVVFVAKEGCIDCTYGELEREIIHVLRQGFASSIPESSF